MNTVIAASLFDSPWALAVVLLISGIASWLSKRRQEKEAQREAGGEDAAPTPAAGEGVSVEEMFRRLLGEEPKPPAAPPPLPRVPTSRAEPVAPRIPEVARQLADTLGVPEEVEGGAAGTLYRRAPVRAEAAESVAVPAPAAAYGSARTATVARLGPVPVTVGPAAFWRDRNHVRQAFVASVVFGPPKGLPHDLG